MEISFMDSVETLEPRIPLASTPVIGSVVTPATTGATTPTEALMATESLFSRDVGTAPSYWPTH